MQQFIRRPDKVHAGSRELALFVVRNRDFPASLKGIRQGPEEGENPWRHSSGIVRPKTSEESD